MYSPYLESIQLKKSEKVVLLTFEDQKPVTISYAFLRFSSPSAENKMNDEKSLEEFMDVNIVDVQHVGHYAIKFLFDDGHQTGLYSFDTLYSLAHEKILITPNK